ncbi:MAG: hypothetical protein CVU52_00190 [Deltaproteobacteria bacterium HGW-Deltaproteobacteria-10]|nr:MAG: hypothetical protein CVU52_00190 [Deltaproteobacteria bacterium HGW-Deltaproteobacteria-10]
MDNCDIKIDKEGTWYYRGAHMFRKDILCIFFENLKIDSSGNYLIELGEEICYLDVEDTAFVVTAVSKTLQEDNANDQIDLQLTDDSLEKLDLSTLYVGNENVLYCSVKDRRFKARFSRNSYYQLAQFIEQDEKENSFFIRLNGEKKYIKTLFNNNVS